MLIDSEELIEAIDEVRDLISVEAYCAITERLKKLPSAEPERLTDDDFETIRIHLNAYKEKLCNQRRWKEAEEYQRIIDRFMALASAERNGKWINHRTDDGHHIADCSICGNTLQWFDDEGGHLFCPNCGAKMEGEQNE